MGGSSIDNDWEFTSPLNGVRTVVLVGRTGNGKSATGNSIIGKKAFKSRASSAGVTSTCELQRTELRDGQILNVIDTPGLFDFSAESELIGKEIVKCISMAKDGIHAVVVVFSVRTRFSKEEEAALRSLQTLFGTKINDYMIVVFTGRDELEDNDETLEDYLGRGCPEPLKDQSLASSSWCRLPEDLVIDQILSRLPVKSLLRFKSVCKGWHALLSTRCFIASHLKYIDTPKRLVSWNGNNNGLLVGHDAFHVFAECCFTRNFQPLNLNFGFDRKPDLVLGPCDGLFCLYWRANSNFIFRELENGVNVERLPTIALWNPATRAFSILPMSNFDFPPYRRAAYCMVGFGFDLTTRSIKVVKVLTLSRAEASHCEFINCAEVYDLGSGSWRFLHLDDMVKDVAVDDELIVSMYNKNDGVFHWRCQLSHTDCVYEVVLSFDMSTELFHMTPLPDKYNEYRVDWDRWKECKFALLRDSLALICSFFDWPYPDDEGHTIVEVWVMKKDFDCMVEAGESSSPYRYSHELTVEPRLPGPCPRLPGPCLSTGFWNKNELLIWKDVDELRAGRSPFLYDIVTKQVRDVEISGELNFMYRENLVSVKGGCGNE